MADGFESLERELQRLSRAVSYPAARPLAAAVRRRLETESARAAPRLGRWPLPAGRRALAGLAAAAVVTLAAVLGLWAPGREAVADFFERLRILQTAESPAGLPSEIMGTPVSKADAEERLGFALKEPSYPKGLRWQRTLLQDFPGFSAAVLFYEGPGGLNFALFQTNGVVAKGLPFGAEAEPVDGMEGEAYWLKGLRIVEYRDERGELIEESRRATDASTLIWDEGGFIFRLEGDLSQDEAIRIAQSLR